MIEEKVKESQENHHALQNGEQKEPDLTVKTVRTLQGFDQLAEEWRKLASEADTYIFETFEWNRIWWKHFGANKQLHILLFYEEEELVGLAPLFWDTFRLAGFQLYRSLRFIGSTVSQPEGEELLGLLPYSDYLDVIIHPGCEERVCNKLVQYLASESDHFDEVIFDEVPEKSVLWDYFVPKMKEQGFQFSVEESSGCPIISLDCSWDEHLSSLSKSSRYRTRRFVKKATKPDYKIFEYEEAKDLQEVNQYYDHLVDLHQERWEELGFPGTFGEERMYDFFKEISEEFFEQGWAQFKSIYALKDNNKCVAVDLIFKYKDRTYLVHRALDADSPAAEESPGNVGLYMMVRESAEEGKEEFDLLRGTESYKFRSANDVLTNRRIKINNSQRDRTTKSEVVQNLVQLKRRARLEAKQFNIFMNHEGRLLDNLRNYGDFVYGRISERFSSE